MARHLAYQKGGFHPDHAVADVDFSLPAVLQRKLQTLPNFPSHHTYVPSVMIEELGVHYVMSCIDCSMCKYARLCKTARDSPAASPTRLRLETVKMLTSSPTIISSASSALVWM